MQWLHNVLCYIGVHWLEIGQVDTYELRSTLNTINKGLIGVDKACQLQLVPQTLKEATDFLKSVKLYA